MRLFAEHLLQRVKLRIQELHRSCCDSSLVMLHVEFTVVC